MMLQLISKVPSPTFYRIYALVLVTIGLVFLTFAGVAVSVDGAGLTHQWWLVACGLAVTLFGVVFPVRIVWIGAQVPPEIGENMKILAVCLPLGGAAMILGGWSIIPVVRTISFGVCGVVICYAAVFGFWKLSRTLPETFYMGEMVSIFLSTGIWGKKEESPADKAFQRWTQGRVEGIPVGERAPDGEVLTLDEGERQRLSDYFPKGGLLVLNFGSYSCPHHRKRLGELTTLYQRWKDKGVDFLTVYTAEAHPEDGWRLNDQYAHDDEFNGNSDDFCFCYAKDAEDRRRMARWLRDKKSFAMPMVCDAMSDDLLHAYNSWPIRLYIIADGEVVFSGRQGPFGYAPLELDDVLKRLVAGSATSTP